MDPSLLLRAHVATGLFVRNPNHPCLEPSLCVACLSARVALFQHRPPLSKSIIPCIDPLLCLSISISSPCFSLTSTVQPIPSSPRHVERHPLAAKRHAALLLCSVDNQRRDHKSPPSTLFHVCAEDALDSSGIVNISFSYAFFCLILPRSRLFPVSPFS